jgi:hypothetical protein
MLETFVTFVPLWLKNDGDAIVAGNGVRRHCETLYFSNKQEENDMSGLLPASYLAVAMT